MGKKEFIGFRIENSIQTIIKKIVAENEEYHSITDFATRALENQIARESEDQTNVLAHPNYPDLITLVSTIPAKENQLFLYDRFEDLHFSEVSWIYSWLKRSLG